MMIPNDQISVVVTGPVLGRSTDSPEVRLTARSLQSARSLLPGAEVVFSTWEKSDLAGLDFDVVVENKDPGTTTIFKQGDRVVYNNMNRQIVSTRAGLAAARRPYVVRLRSDSVLEGLGFLEYFGKFNRRNQRWRLFRERVVGSTIFSREPNASRSPFHPSDWFYFGLREDVLNLWTIPLASEPEHSRWFEARPHPRNDHEVAISKWTWRFIAEQYIWLTFLRKYGNVDCDHYCDCTPKNIWLTELTIANNLVLVEPERLGVRSLKYDTARYRHCHTLYTHNEWLKLYLDYCQRGTPTFSRTRWRSWLLDILGRADLAICKLPFVWRGSRLIRPLLDLVKMRHDWQRPTVEA